MTSYHEYNKVEKARQLVGQLQAGRSIALVTDAGTPAISDPGEVLVRMCQDGALHQNIYTADRQDLQWCTRESTWLAVCSGVVLHI